MFNQYVRSNYRYDIQGIRALGAILIMVFHIWFNKVSGGVDVFFVISGFLMSSILLKGFFLDGTVSPFPFWGSIIKRVAPSAYLILAVTLIASYFIGSPAFLMGVVKEIIASALHLENIQLIRTSVDYLSSSQPPSPVQQFWALSIQIQFYVVLPFILIPLAFFSKRRGNSSPLFVGVVFIIIVSFIYAVISVKSDPTSSYFSPLSRIWEFFFGILTFLLVSNFQITRYKQILGVSGIALIIGGAIFIPRGSGFPGFVSLIPVLGAMFIIISGTNGYEGLANKFLSSKPLVFLGGISFTIYLWHWPILIFYKNYSGYISVGFFQGLLIIITSIFLAYLTNKKIESPFRKIPREKVIINFSIGILFFLPIITMAFMLKYEISSVITKSRLELENGATEAFSGDVIYLEEQRSKFNRNEIISAKGLLPKSSYNGCNQGNGSEVLTCSFGDLESDRAVVLVGSSHAQQWLPVLNEIGKKDNFKVISMTKNGCPLGVTKESNRACQEWNAGAIEEIINLKPNAVITNSTKTSIDKKEFVPEAYVRSWEILASNEINVIGIRDNPRFNFEVLDCIYINNNSPDPISCSIDRTDSLLKNDPAIRYKNIIHLIDMSDMLCTETKCLTTFAGKLMYRDSNHMSVEYMYFMQDYFKEKLRSIFADID